ncbi:MAG TPA: pantetheine-phosphate adenylyltransferase [Alphaproteobacteria bacterium]|nr:pantetheine-phosphate adenylyltransferase [Alphaproteobacteria bacterium]
MGKARVGLSPGTFDPITFGHMDILRRASKLVDRLVVGVAVNPGKDPLFEFDERVEMVKHVTEPMSSELGIEIDVRPFDGLLIHFAEEVGASIIIRGLRAVADFEFEYQMVGMNRTLNPDIEIAFLMADAKYQAIASRLVKEIAALGGDISAFVSPEVVKRVTERLAARSGT